MVLSVIYLSTLDNYWKPFWDSALYISLAKSLAAGDGYCYMGLPHAKYPFVFPLLLSPIVGLCGLNFLVMRLLILILAIASFWLIYILFRKLTDEGTAFAVMLLTGFSPAVLHLSTWILSEVPYMFFSLCTLCLFIDYGQEKRCFTKTGLLASILLLATIFTRTIGITLAVAVLLDLLCSSAKGCFTRNAKKMVLIGIIIATPLSLWFYRGHLVNRQFPFQPEYRGVLNYQKEFFVRVPDNIRSESISYKDFIERIRDNLKVYAETMAHYIANNITSSPARLFLLLFFLYGYIHRFIKRRTAVEYYFTFYLITCIGWWFNLHPERFLAPVIPFIFFYFITGVQSGAFLLGRIVVKPETDKAERAQGWIAGLLVFFLIATNFSFKPGAIKSERRKQFHPPALIDEFFSAIAWIKENTGLDTVIMSSRAPWIFMLTDRKTLTFPLFEPLSYIVDSLIAHGVEYVVVSDIEHTVYEMLHHFVESHPRQFVRVFTSNKTSVYKIASENLGLLRGEITMHPDNKTPWQK